MRYIALIKKVDEWWIGWLVDLPGVNAQEKTREELIESPRIGAEGMLATEVAAGPGAQMTTIEVTEPYWAGVCQ